MPTLDYFTNVFRHVFPQATEESCWTFPGRIFFLGHHIISVSYEEAGPQGEAVIKGVWSINPMNELWGRDHGTQVKLEGAKITDQIVMSTDEDVDGWVSCLRTDILNLALVSLSSPLHPSDLFPLGVMREAGHLSRPIQHLCLLGLSQKQTIHALAEYMLPYVHTFEFNPDTNKLAMHVNSGEKGVVVARYGFSVTGNKTVEYALQIPVATTIIQKQDNHLLNEMPDDPIAYLKAFVLTKYLDEMLRTVLMQSTFTMKQLRGWVT